MTIFGMYSREKTIPLTANQGLIHVVNKYPTFLEPGQLSVKVEDLMPNYLESKGQTTCSMTKFRV